MKIARVFPRRTKATPTDDYAFVGEPPLGCEDFDEIHVSVTFTWDLPEAERLVRAWKPYGVVKIGGPATGMRGEEFTPGMYVKDGYIITSRGCPNKCWFCSVPKREGVLREFKFDYDYHSKLFASRKHWNVLDDNILACSNSHLLSLWVYLSSNFNTVEFTGGWEAKRLNEWKANLFAHRSKQIFFAYDTPDDWKPLCLASELLWDKGITRKSHKVRCYVLIGYKKDTFEKASQRLQSVLSLGVIPMAMLWRDEKGKTDLEWRRFQRLWARPALIAKHAMDGREVVNG